jgi:hypothetical protein
LKAAAKPAATIDQPARRDLSMNRRPWSNPHNSPEWVARELGLPAVRRIAEDHRRAAGVITDPDGHEFFERRDGQDDRLLIQHAVWLYLRFTLSYRDVENLLAERGLDVSYESVRSSVLKFGQ